MTDFLPRPEADTLAERTFLERRLAEVEKDMGRLAAKLGTPVPATQQLEVLDRARELLSDLLRQIRVRTLDDALGARLDWLERAQARRENADDPEPKPSLSRMSLDARLLADLRRAWSATVR